MDAQGFSECYVVEISGITGLAEGGGGRLKAFLCTAGQFYSVASTGEAGQS